jgi:hypothetical protein
MNGKHETQTNDEVIVVKCKRRRQRLRGIRFVSRSIFINLVDI